MRIILKRVRKSLPEYGAVRELYNTAFPADERAPFLLLASKAGRDGVDFMSVYEDGRWTGFYYAISEGDLTYLFYLAVRDGDRGKGCGRRILRTALRMYEGQRLFLALEPLDDNADNREERIRRRKFYEKSGLSPMSRRIREGKMVYDVMGVGGDVEPHEYRQMMKNYMGGLLSKIVDMQVITPEGKDTKNEIRAEDRH